MQDRRGFGWSGGLPVGSGQPPHPHHHRLPAPHDPVGSHKQDHLLHQVPQADSGENISCVESINQILCKHEILHFLTTPPPPPHPQETKSIYSA